MGRGRLFSSLIALSFLAAAGCEDISPPVVMQGQTGCTAGQAQIQVSDGYMKRLCGCTEPDNVSFPSPGTLTCTIHQGTTVFFYFIANFNHHQIVPASGGDLTFPGSFVSDVDTGEIQPYSFQFNDQGQANFEDAYDTAMQGQIIVTP